MTRPASALRREDFDAPRSFGRHLLSILALFGTAVVPEEAQAQVGVTTSLVVIGSESLAVARWYPARAGGARLAVGDYVLYGGCSAGPGNPEGFATWLSEQLGRPIQPQDMVPVLSRKLLAVRDAPPAKRVPIGRVLILSGPSAEPWFHTTLAEQLAAAGLEVLAWAPCRPLGGFDTASVRRQEQEALALLADARAARGPQPVVLVAWSLGGVAAARIGAAQDEVRGLVSLDAALAYAYGEEVLKAMGFRPATLRVPLLLLEAGRAGPVAGSRWVGDSAGSARRLRARVPGIPHAGFADPYLLWLPGRGTDSAGPQLATMKELVVRFVRETVTGAAVMTILPGPAWRAE